MTLRHPNTITTRVEMLVRAGGLQSQPSPLERDALRTLGRVLDTRTMAGLVSFIERVRDDQLGRVRKAVEL